MGRYDEWRAVLRGKSQMVDKTKPNNKKKLLKKWTE